MMAMLRNFLLIISLALFSTLSFMLLVQHGFQRGGLITFYETMEPGSISLIDKPSANRTLGNADPFLLYGLCRFDISKTDFEVELPFWHDYWSVSLLTPEGDTTFSLGRRPLISENETIILTRRTALDKADDINQSLSSRINPQTEEGMVLFRLAVPTEELRRDAARVVTNLLCRERH